MLTPTLALMRFRAHGTTCLAAVCLLGGCASSPAVRQAKQNDPIVVVTVQSTPAKKPVEKPPESKAAQLEKALKDAEAFGLVGVLKAGEPGEGSIESVFGSSTGGVIGGPVGGFGGLGGIGIGGGGTGQGFGSIGIIGRANKPQSFSIRGSTGQTKVKVEHVVVSGPLMLDEVQRQVDQHRDDIQRCHRLEQIDGVARWGSARFMFTIDPTGHVSEAHVYDSTLSSRELEDCIAHTIGAFEFPPPGADKIETVILPISF